MSQHRQKTQSKRKSVKIVWKSSIYKLNKQSKLKSKIKANKPKSTSTGYKSCVISPSRLNAKAQSRKLRKTFRCKMDTRNKSCKQSEFTIPSTWPENPLQMDPHVPIKPIGTHMVGVMPYESINSDPHIIGLYKIYIHPIHI